MSRNRASALLASVVATAAATVGLALLTPGTALAQPAAPPSATAKAPYPAAPPTMVVNKGVVKVGQSVKATGRKYQKKERVSITITFRPTGFKGKSTLVGSKTVRADSKGHFVVTVKMPKAGTVTIRGKGLTTGKAAMATLQVVKKTGGGGGWVIRPAAFSTGLSGNTAVATVPNTSDGGLAGLAGLGVMALAGSVGVTRTVVRRRRLGVAA